MLEIEEIQRRLADRRPSFVSLETGVSVGTILAIRDGRQKNPTLATMRRLSEYLERKP